MKLRNILAIVPMIAVLYASHALAEEVYACRGCDDPLVFDEDQYACFRHKRINELDENGRTVRFSLDQASCAASDGKGKGGTADAKGPNQVAGAQTYKIDRKQLKCLKTRPDLWRKDGNTYVFDFVSCPK